MSAEPVQAESRPGRVDTTYVEVLDELDTHRSIFGTWLFITSEAVIFTLLFFSYLYLGKGGERWENEEPPSLVYAIPMLIILLLSSIVLHLGERRVRKGRYGAGRIAIVITLVLAAVFLFLSYLDYQDHLEHLLPTSNSYGSIFYTIISVHLAHVIGGVCMLLFVLVLPPLEPNVRPPHQPYRSATLYWHFVDVVWFFVVGLLFIYPYFWN